jgi:hypothetical protein
MYKINFYLPVTALDCLKKRSNSSEMHLCQKRKEATSALTLKSIWSNKKKDNTTNRSRKTKN